MYLELNKAKTMLTIADREDLSDYDNARFELSMPEVYAFISDLETYVEDMLLDAKAEAKIDLLAQKTIIEKQLAELGDKMTQEVQPTTKEEIEAQEVFMTKIVPILKSIMKDPIKAYVKVQSLHICVHSHNEDELYNLSKLLRDTKLPYATKEGFKIYKGSISKFCVVSSIERLLALGETK
jgi:hypothetical protein